MSKNHFQKVNVKIIDETGLLDNRKEKLLTEYGKRYCETLVYMKSENIQDLYYDYSNMEYNINQTAFDIISGIRNMNDKNLTLDYMELEYVIKDISFSDNKAKIWLVENNKQKFGFLSDSSDSYNLNHWFTLEKIDGKWYIEKHEQEEDFYLLTIEVWENIYCDDNKEKATLVKETILNDAMENLTNKKQFQQGEYLNLNVNDTSYDRNKAVKYANEWCNKRNMEYSAYDDLGGNCQNFASQCLHAGGIYMDYSGVIDLQWKYFGDNIVDNQIRNGRSYSWTGVDMFYVYAKNNYTDGLVSLTDIDFSYAEPGDIIHVGAYNDWRHALVITDVKKDAHGNTEEIIVASNTADRKNYPLSAYTYTAARLIHILGQN